MNNKVTILIFVFFCTSTLNAQAQFAALITNAARRIYIKGPDYTYTNLIWSNIGFGNECIALDRTEGFAINKNLVPKTKAELQHIVIKLYDDCGNVHVRNEDSLTFMTINLFFERLPDTVDYYLKIPYIKKGKVLNITIPKKYQNFISADSCCKTLIIRSYPPLVKLIDISKTVFPRN